MSREPLVKLKGSASWISLNSSMLKNPRMCVGMSVCSCSGVLSSLAAARM